MREILFRGKHGDNWFEGNLVMYNGKSVISRQAQDAPGTVGYEVNPETVCQFTGLTDKNGQKIWENDICRCVEVIPSETIEFISKVEWLDYGYVFETSDGGYPLCNFDNSYDWLSHVPEIEVIGNIFDNPELMEGGAK
ncbi:MAG: YopX family protein [Bacillota bacterium]|nr:YopX family protein [Bacillota bacterium]